MSVNLRDPRTLLPITFSASAVAQVKKEMEKQTHAIGVRLQLQPAGCSGYSYKLQVIDAPVATDDYCFNHDITLYVEKKSYPLLQGTEIDFVREGLNQIFKYHNPNQTGVCGCGESFTIDQKFSGLT